MSAGRRKKRFGMPSLFVIDRLQLSGVRIALRSARFARKRTFVRARGTTALGQKGTFAAL